MGRRGARGAAWAAVIAACALAVAAGPSRAHPPRGSETVVFRGGPSAAPLVASLDVELHGIAPSQPIRLAWQEEDGALVAHASTASWTAMAKITSAARGSSDPAATFEIAIRYLVDAEVVREALILELPGPPRAIGRDLRFGAVTGELRIDRGTPILVETSTDRGRLVIMPAHGFVAARVVPSELRLIIDDEDAHPFEVFDTCHTTWAIGNDDAPRSRKARTARRSGQTVGGAALVYVNASTDQFTPLLVERWPGGASAALVFTDHADRTDPDGLRAILYGTSKKSSASYGKGGFLGHGLKLTKTLFASSGSGTLASKEMRRLADEIVKAGGEIGSHSITEGRDGRDRVGRKLKQFAPWNVVTWIDHQPQTNCEAVTAQGWADDGQYGIRDLLVKGGIRWIWAAQDAGPKNALWNLFDPSHPDVAAPAIYPLPVDERLWMFRSSWFYEDAETLAAAIDDGELDRLERERGLFVAHTYLSPTKKTTKRAELRRRSLVDVKKDVATLHPAFDEALGRIAARVKRGTSASLTWREAGDRLRALDDVVVKYEPDGSATIENRGKETISDLTISVQGSAELGLDVTLRGTNAKGRLQGPDRLSIWLDLAPGELVTVQVKTKHAELDFLPGVEVKAELAP